MLKTSHCQYNESNLTSFVNTETGWLILLEVHQDKTKKYTARSPGGFLAAKFYDLTKSEFKRTVKSWM